MQTFPRSRRLCGSGHGTPLRKYAYLPPHCTKNKSALVRLGIRDWSWSNDLPAALSLYRLSSITLDVGTAVSTRPLACYPHSHLVVVKPSLGLDLGCQDLSPVRQPVQFGPAELQIPGQFVKSERSVRLSSSPLPRGSIKQTKRMRTKADEGQRRRTNTDEGGRIQTNVNEEWAHYQILTLQEHFAIQ